MNALTLHNPLALGKRRRKTQREILSELFGNMTVCIAALCDQRRTLVCACDRKLTYGPITTEPDSSKVFELVLDRIVLLIAGDIHVQTEVVADVFEHFEKLNPASAPSVKSVAQAFEDCYGRWFQRCVKKRILEPLLLDESWHNAGGRVTEMVQQKIDLLQNQIQVATIIAGHDETSGHIWVFDNQDGLSCQDKVGFAAIGSGATIALTQFISEKHVPHRGFAETLLLVYLAKKRSEKAPGVGDATDFFKLSTNGLQWANSGPGGTNLKAIVEAIEDRHKQSIERARSELREALENNPIDDTTP